MSELRVQAGRLREQVLSDGEELVSVREVGCPCSKTVPGDALRFLERLGMTVGRRRCWPWLSVLSSREEPCVILLSPHLFNRLRRVSGRTELFELPLRAAVATG